MRMPRDMFKRLMMLHANGLVGAGTEPYAKPRRRLDDRNPVSRAIPYYPFVPANMINGAGTVCGYYGSTAPYIYTAHPVVIYNDFGGAGTVAAGARTGPLAYSTQVAPGNS